MDKNKRSILIGVCFIVIAIATVFLIDYFQTQNLLKNGIRTNAIITGKYCEIKLNSEDTTGYSMRFEAVSDTNENRSYFFPVVRLGAFVKKEAFYKYNEGSTVKIVYYNDDLEHARLVEEIE